MPVPPGHRDGSARARSAEQGQTAQCHQPGDEGAEEEVLGHPVHLGLILGEESSGKRSSPLAAITMLAAVN